MQKEVCQVSGTFWLVRSSLSSFRRFQLNLTSKEAAIYYSQRRGEARLVLERSKIFIPLILAVLVALIFVLPIFRNFSYWGIQDWDQHLFYHAVPRSTLIDYHQFPLWNPYYCGGTVMLANPQSRFLSPSFLLILLFGPVKGIKLEIFLHFIIGLLGMYKLGRHYKMDKWTACLPAIVYMLSSMFSLNLTVGVTWFSSVAYLPWAFLFYLKGFEEWKFALLSGLFLVLIYFGGGAYLLIMAILFFGLFSLLSLRGHGIARVSKSFILLFVFTISLGAIKFFPSFEFLKEHPRHISDYSGYSVKMLYHSLLSRDQSLAAVQKYPQKAGFWDGMSYAMDENGMYIGIIPFLFFLFALASNIFGPRLGARSHWNPQRRLTLCFLVFLWLGFGDRIPLSLWKLLHALPVFDSMRVAQRFRIVFMLIMALFVGFGFRSLLSILGQKLKNKRHLQLLRAGVPIVVLIDLISVNSPIFKDAFPIPPLSVERQESFSQISEGKNYDANGVVTQAPLHMYSSWSSLYPAFLSNLGTIQAYEPLNVPKNTIPKDSSNYKGEAFFWGTSGKLSIDYWSPNRVVVSVQPRREGYLVLNQNYYSGWKAKGRRPRRVESVDCRSGVEGKSGFLLLGVRIFPEDKVIEFYYSPLSFRVGLIVTCLSFLVGALVWIRK
jgi:hypothetical protein